MSKKALILAAALVATVAPSAEAATALDVRKCIGALLSNLGVAAKCRYKVESKFFINGDSVKRDLNAEKCVTKAFDKRETIVAKYGDACPGDGTSFAALGTPASLATRLAGLFVSPALAVDGEVSIGDVFDQSLKSLSTQVVGDGTSLTAKTDQLTADPTKLEPRDELTADGSTLTQAILAELTDSSTGRLATARSAPGTRFLLGSGGLTAVDTATGLEWELKTPGSGDVHDPTFQLSYQGACSVFPHPHCLTTAECPGLGFCIEPIGNFPMITGIIGAMNAAAFAGRTDWRIPTEAELNTLKRNPCGGSTPPCTVLPGPTRSDLAYWTSTPDPMDSIKNLTVSFATTGQTSKTRFADNNELLYFRAVRTNF